MCVCVCVCVGVTFFLPFGSLLFARANFMSVVFIQTRVSLVVCVFEGEGRGGGGG